MWNVVSAAQADWFIAGCSNTRQKDNPMSPMDKVDSDAEIGKQLSQLTKEHGKAMASYDWARAANLQEKVAELMNRKEAFRPRG
jgi:hypothetical protein